MSIDHDIEWALRDPIYTAMKTAGAPYIQASGEPSIQLPNEPLDTAPLDRYCRFGFFPAPPVVREVGPTPAMTRKGYIGVDVFVRLGLGTDQVNDFISLIRSAYPYATTLTRNGTQVVLDIIQVRAGTEQSAWFMTNINVFFDVWR